VEQETQKEEIRSENRVSAFHNKDTIINAKCCCRLCIFAVVAVTDTQTATETSEW